jgi:two-component system, cell cycle sensor histidine kinase and response regulator CckA
MAPRTLLLVDDEPAVLAFTTLVLQRAGYHVLTAKNGIEGLNEFLKSKDEISIVVTDVMMPQMDGVKMAKAIRLENPTLKVVFISGYAPSDELSGLVEAWSATFLAKPFTIQSLEAAITDPFAGSMSGKSTHTLPTQASDG